MAQEEKKWLVRPNEKAAWEKCILLIQASMYHLKDWFWLSKGGVQSLPKECIMPLIKRFGSGSCNKNITSWKKMHFCKSPESYFTGYIFKSSIIKGSLNSVMEKNVIFITALMERLILEAGRCSNGWRRLGVCNWGGGYEFLQAWWL